MSSAGIVIAATALVTLLFPVPSDRLTISTLKSIPWLPAGDRGQIAVVGNSVIDHASNCDPDQRTVVQMIGDKTGKRAIDLSYAGQQLTEAINYASVALQSPNVSALVVFVSAFQFNVSPSLDAHTQAFFRLAGGPFRGDDLMPRLVGDEPYAPQVQAQQLAFSYDGVDYPNYVGIKQQYFSLESKLEGCPEGLGVNLRLIEAYYWNLYLRDAALPQYVSDLALLSRQAVAQGKPMRLVVMPVDYDDITRLNPALTPAIAGAVGHLVRAMRAADLAPIDMSAGLPADAFSNRWCACGHLQQAGRQALADQVAVALK